MKELIKMLLNSKKFNGYIEDLEKGSSPVVSLTGLTNVAKTYFVYGTKEYANKKVCIVTYNEIQARNLVKNLEFFTSKVVFIPKKEIVTYLEKTFSQDISTMTSPFEPKFNIFIWTPRKERQ